MSELATIDLLTDPRVPSWLASQFAAINSSARIAEIEGDHAKMASLRRQAERLMHVAYPYLERDLPVVPVDVPTVDVVEEVEAILAPVSAPTTSLPAVPQRANYDPGWIAPARAKTSPWTLISIAGAILVAGVGLATWFLRRR